MKKNRGIQQYLEKLDTTKTTDYSLWRATKKLKQPQTLSQPLRTTKNGWDRHDIEKAKTFADLINVFKPNPVASTDIISSIEEKEEEDNITFQSNSLPKNFTKQEVLKAIHRIDQKKAPGYELITDRLLRKLPGEGITYLTQLFNSILRVRYIPPQWKVAQVIMTLKPGKPVEEFRHTGQSVCSPQRYWND